MGQNSTAQNLTKLKNLKFYKTQKLKYDKIKKNKDLKMRQKNSKCDKTY